MVCELNCKKHSKFKSFGRSFIEFWHNYFQSTGISVNNLPIKHFLSAVDLMKLCDLSACGCKDLVKNLYQNPTYVCKYCGKSFSTLTQLRMHKAKYNKKQQKPQTFSCVFCTKCLSTKAGLLRHLELHTKEYECKICKKAFDLFNFDRHKTTPKHLKRIMNLPTHGNRKTNRKS